MSVASAGLGVHVVGLQKSFGSFRALSGLDLDVPVGTVAGLLGPNGAGKTTTIRILATLTTADSGSAWVGGHNVADDPHSVRSVIALTGQYAAVDGDLTGRQNLVMIAHLCRFSRAYARTRADELLARFGLGAASGRLVRTYSGGMRRRLDLAASLVSPPRVLFLDEPTTGLDPPSREELWGVVRDLKAEGTTVVLTTQYLEEADRLADDITVIDHGKAVARGTATELKATVGGDIIELRSRQPSLLEPAAALVARRAGAGDYAVNLLTEAGSATVAIPSGSLSTVDAVRILDAAGLPMDEISLRRASLDEVFTTLTRRK
ncbi:MAG TPA: ATP-binding cassette domain-containing protein [Acidimicrobiales bacterium]|nr:ATP-binding cassette domain-containing protein [Acidimicrobiales bacterium]